MKKKRLLTCSLVVSLLSSILFTPTQPVLANEPAPLSELIFYCSCGRECRPRFDFLNAYCVAINDSQHQAMTPYTVFCACGATPIRGVYPDTISNHRFSLIDLGHSPLHTYQKYCSICNYSGEQVKVPCSGPPCVAPYAYNN